MASDSPTLLDDLEAAELVVRRIQGPDHLSKRLRAAHARLREEMQRTCMASNTADGCCSALRRINNGPLEPTP